MAGLDTSWNIGDRVIHLEDVSRYLDLRKRRVHQISARLLYKLLERRLSIQKGRMRHADISVPIILVVDRVTFRPDVVLDGNHRLAKAVVTNSDIPFRVLYSDEYDMMFGS